MCLSAAPDQSEIYVPIFKDYAARNKSQYLLEGGFQSLAHHFIPEWVRTTLTHVSPSYQPSASFWSRSGFRLSMERP